MFKKGDRVVCVDAKNTVFRCSLKEGAVYTVEDSRALGLQLVGVRDVFNVNRFRLADEPTAPRPFKVGDVVRYEVHENGARWNGAHDNGPSGTFAKGSVVRADHYAFDVSMSFGAWGFFQPGQPLHPGPNAPGFPVLVQAADEEPEPPETSPADTVPKLIRTRERFEMVMRDEDGDWVAMVTDGERWGGRAHEEKQSAVYDVSRLDMKFSLRSEQGVYWNTNRFALLTAYEAEFPQQGVGYCDARGPHPHTDDCNEQCNNEVPSEEPTRCPHDGREVLARVKVRLHQEPVRVKRYSPEAIQWRLANAHAEEDAMMAARRQVQRTATKVPTCSFGGVVLIDTRIEGDEAVAVIRCVTCEEPGPGVGP